MSVAISLLKNVGANLLILGVLATVSVVSIQARAPKSDLRAAPDDPEHYQHCVVCQSENHFGGLKPKPAPSPEVQERLLSEDPQREDEGAEESEEYVESEEMPPLETIETAHIRKLKVHQDVQKAEQSSSLRPRTSVRPSAS